VRVVRVPTALLGWPRRAAAALCFLLAAVAAVAAPHKERHTLAPRPSLPAGMVTTSVTVYADGLAFVHVGDRIDLIAPAVAGDASAGEPIPTVVAHGVQVLAMRAQRDSLTDAAVSQVLLAAPRDVAVKIAAEQGRHVLAAVSAPP
jgi:hypothetical protein